MTKAAEIASFFKKTCFYSLCVLWVALTFSSALVEISFAVALAAWLIWKTQTRSGFFAPIPKAVWVPLLGFVLLAVLSYFWSEYPKQSGRGILKVLQQVMIFWMVMDVFSSFKNLRPFEIVFCLLFYVVLGNSFYQYAFGKDLIRGFTTEAASAGVRVSGSFKTYGQLGSYLISTIPLFIVLGFKGIRLKKDTLRFLLAFAGTAGGLIVLFLTRSRGAFLAFLLGCVFLLIIKRRWIPLLVLGGIALGSFFILPRGMMIHLDKDGKEQSLVERYYLWDRAVHVIKVKPWGGTGINTYTAAHAKYDKTQNWRVRGYYAHNGYLQLAAETGLPCLFFFLLFLFQYLRLLFKPHEGSSPLGGGAPLLGIGIGLINFLLLVLVDTSLHNPQPAMMFWFLLGLGRAYINIAGPNRQTVSSNRMKNGFSPKRILLPAWAQTVRCFLLRSSGESFLPAF